MNDTKIDRELAEAAPQADAGYLPPGVTFEMKLAAIKAYNRTSGKCSPVSIADAVKAALDVMPANDVNRIASVELSILVYEWLVAIGKLDRGVVYHNDKIMSVLENFAVQAAAKSDDEAYKGTVMKIREILQRGDWMTKGHSANVVDAVQRLCAAKRSPSRNTEAEQLGIDIRNLLISYGIGDLSLTGPQVYDIVLGYVQAYKGEGRPDPVKLRHDTIRRFERGDDYMEHDADHRRYDINEPALNWKGKIAVWGDEHLRNFIVEMLNTLGEPIRLRPGLEIDPIHPPVATPTVNAVDHPSHYGGEENPYEVIKVLEAWLSYDEFVGAMKFNIHKYLARAPHKAVELEDYEKGMWYTARLVDYMKRHPR